jgi:hypothetical protein
MKYISLFIFMLILTACGDASRFSVPSDYQAQYFVIEIAGSRNEPTITTKRVGSIGESYSRRIYNCSKNTVRYLGTGSTLRKMKMSKGGEKMTPVVYKSIAYYVGQKVCN